MSINSSVDRAGFCYQCQCTYIMCVCAHLLAVGGLLDQASENARCKGIASNPETSRLALRTFFVQAIPLSSFPTHHPNSHTQEPSHSPTSSVFFSLRHLIGSASSISFTFVLGSLIMYTAESHLQHHIIYMIICNCACCLAALK